MACGLSCHDDIKDIRRLQRSLVETPNALLQEQKKITFFSTHDGLLVESKVSIGRIATGLGSGDP